MALMPTIPDDATAGNRWSAALLLTLSGFTDDEEWVPLNTAHELANEVARGQFSCEVTYSTQRNMKRDLARQELVEQRRVGKSFELRITSSGREAVAVIEANPSWGLPTPENTPSLTDWIGRRVGMGHFLPRAAFGEMMKRINAGEVDMILIPHDKSTKITYWDEA